MKSKYEKKLEVLLEKSVFTAADAREQSIPSRMLSHFCELGIIDRLGRGVYKNTQMETGIHMDVEDLVLTATSIPEGIICLTSALYLYQFTDQLLREYWIAVPNKNDNDALTLPY